MLTTCRSLSMLKEVRLVAIFILLWPLILVMCFQICYGSQDSREATGVRKSANHSANDTRKGAKVELVLDKQEYFLGENILLHYGVTNHGIEPFRINTGGDYRAAPRHLRFKVIAIDTNGKQVEDPYSTTMSMGGMGGEPTLQPGQSWWTSLPLMRYCDFDNPGVYKIRVYHDLGWEGFDYHRDMHVNALPQEKHTAPIVETTIKLVMPNNKQARQVFEHMLTLPKDPQAVYGQRIAKHADFSAMRYQVYLPIVSKMAQEGDERGLDAISATATPEATRELIKLLANKHENISTKAINSLLKRLPAPQTQKNIWFRTLRRSLANRSWRADMKPDVLNWGWKLLAENDRNCLINGAYIIRCLGTEDDFPRFEKFLDRGLVAMKDDPIEQDSFPRPRNASEALIDAGWELIERGAIAPTQPKTPGQAAQFMVALGRREDFRPAGWQVTAADLLNHPIPFVRAVTLENLPPTLTPLQLDIAATLIEDEHLLVQIYACRLAKKTKSQQFQTPLLNVLETTKDRWLLNEAYYAALMCGASQDRLLEICVERLADNDLATKLFDLMIKIVEREGGHGYSHVDWSQADELRARWKLFIENNRDRIRTGAKFKIAEHPLTPDLFPRGFSFRRRDNSPWPQWPPK